MKTCHLALLYSALIQFIQTETDQRGCLVLYKLILLGLFLLWKLGCVFYACTELKAIETRLSLCVCVCVTVVEITQSEKLTVS